MLKENAKTPFAFSVDVEDWYNCSRELFPEVDSIKVPVPDHSVIANTRKVMDILESSENTATFFVLTTLCEHYPDLVKEIDARGHEVGVHTYSHRLLYKMSREEFIADLDKSLSLLTNCGVESVNGFRAPYWSVTNESLWVLDVLKQYGFKYDSSIFPIHRGLYGIADAPTSPFITKSGLIEVPPATQRIAGQNIPIAGGGYLRFTPEIILRKMIDSKWSKRVPSVFYCHPYEMDPDDTHASENVSGFKSRVYMAQQRYGREKNPIKLERLMNSYKFTSIGKLINDLHNLPVSTKI